MPKTSQAPPRGGFHFPRSPCLCFLSSAWLADPGFLEIESGSVLPEPHLGVQVPGQGRLILSIFWGVGPTCFLPLTRPFKVRLLLISGLIWVLLGDEMDTDG